MKVVEAVIVDKDILGGTPVFKGTRVPVKNLFDYLEAGDSLNDFLNDFDYIPRDYCLAVLQTSEKLLTDAHLYENIN
ncbi:DUF433 domain-containing protein [Mucilaginibacter mali]|uniref:DUF433 domain-containing protein n=1 Tax=Mucilaginibacter mali TaxID=2740462 RepID=A0A7D4TKF8_9SPHI|nr:DUF433 domain-containing protein [Mucilaginibacter mali]QKJ28673.1 DUF433 domain-containing protein [Mucilaginibacter mali]